MKLSITTTGMKGITMWEPWATLLVGGEKQVETRPMRTHHRGPLVIGAAAEINREGIAAVRESPVFRVALARIFGDPENVTADFLLERLKERAGKLVGLVTVTGCMPTQEVLAYSKVTEKERRFGNWATGRFAWLCAEHKKLHQPIPWKGKQGFWHVPHSIVEQIEWDLDGNTRFSDGGITE